MERDGQGLRILGRDECLALLRTARLGRVALTHQALPIILPVAHVCDQQDVLFGVGPGVIARAATDRQIVCFEADWADSEFCNTWSVSVLGQLSIISDGVELERVRAMCRQAWAGSAQEMIRLTASGFSGRAIGPTPFLSI